MTKAEIINAAIAKGQTVTIATYLRRVPVKAKHVKAWADAGYEFFKTESSGATVMIAGHKNGKPRYECIDGAKVFVS